MGLPPSLAQFDRLWDYGDPAATREKFESLLPEAEAWAEKSGDRSPLLQLRTQIARTHALERGFDEAHVVLDAIEPEMEGAPTVVQVRYLLERGRAINSSGAPETASPLFLEAWNLAREAGEDFFAVDAAHMLGITEKGEASIRWNEEAIAWAEKSESERARGWLGSLYNNLGWTYHDLGDFDRALDLFERALAFREQQGDSENVRIAKWCVARCWRSLGRLEEALAAQEALLAEYAAAGVEGAGYTEEELGECHLALGRPDVAAGWFRAAWEKLSKDPWLQANESDRLARMAELGGVTP
jgi:tetratricopeptide (TPR) repeat protein